MPAYVWLPYGLAPPRLNSSDRRKMGLLLCMVSSLEAGVYESILRTRYRLNAGPRPGVPPAAVDWLKSSAGQRRTMRTAKVRRAHPGWSALAGFLQLLDLVGELGDPRGEA